MRFSFGKIWAAAVCLLVFASCAKDTSESYAGIEQRSLDAWMKLHRPELLGNRQEARGFSYYVDVLDAGSTDKADTLIAETDCWVQYEFTARDLNGNVCMTRNAVQAKQQGTFTRYPYYSPYFRYSGSDYTTLLEGSYYALREPLTLSEEYIAEHPDRGLKNGMQARRGTELMLYLPSSLAYSSSGASSDAGYGGQYELDANRPAILHIKVTGRVSNPLAYEGETVDAFVEDNGTVCPVEEEEDKDDPKLASVRRSLRDAETDEPRHQAFARSSFGFGEVDDGAGDDERKPKNCVKTVEDLIGNMEAQNAVVVIGHDCDLLQLVVSGKLRALEVVRVQQTVHGVVHRSGAEINVDLTHDGVLVRACQVHGLAEFVVGIEALLTGKQNGIAVREQIADSPTGGTGGDSAKTHNLKQTAAAENDTRRAFFKLVNGHLCVPFYRLMG